MRNIIPIIIVAAAMVVGCQTSKQAGKTTAAGATTSTNGVAGASAAAAAPVPAGPNTPDQTLAENKKLGNLAGAFLGILYVAALKRP